jgi:hypothetical protein
VSKGEHGWNEMAYKNPEDKKRYDKIYWKKWYTKNKKLKKKRNKTYFKKYYKKNRKKLIAKAFTKVKPRKLKIKKTIIDYKKNNPCRCGESDPRCLDFHHLHDKEFEISQMVRDGISLKRIMTEIDKCEILCANCHRKLGLHG